MLQRFKVIRQLCGKRDISVAYDLKRQACVVLKRHEHLDNFCTELQNLERIQSVYPTHPNAHLVRHIDTCLTTKTITLPYVKGRDMLDHLISLLKQKGRGMKEKESRLWLDKAHSCIDALHNNGLAHLDIKLENFITTPHLGREEDVTLIDVQTLKSAPIHEYGKLIKDTGTMLYQSPEVNLNRQYHKNTDLWGLGLCAYILCEGTHPFQRSDVTYRNIQSFVYDNLDFMSNEYRDNVAALLSTNPNERSYVPF